MTRHARVRVVALSWMAGGCASTLSVVGGQGAEASSPTGRSHLHLGSDVGVIASYRFWRALTVYVAPRHRYDWVDVAAWAHGQRSSATGSAHSWTVSLGAVLWEGFTVEVAVTHAPVAAGEDGLRAVLGLGVVGLRPY